MPLIVITNALNIAVLLEEWRNITVVVAGGTLRAAQHSPVNSLGTQLISRLFEDISFMGASGVHPVAGITVSNLEGAEIEQAMMRQAEKVVVVADHTMGGRPTHASAVRFDDRRRTRNLARVVLRNVTKKYGEVTAVRDFNLEIADREFVVFVGPSGCGKSTTLRMIAGLEEVTSGQIYIDDRLVNDVEPKDRDIAMVFQNYALYPHMNVYDNMAFGLKLRKFPRHEIERRVREAAAILGLENLLGRKPRELSGGQRQRVALGRAIVRNPKVFLMDEPLSNLDAQLRVQMRTELAKLHQRLRTTTIYVTHDQVEAMTMGDRIVVMKDGIIQQVASPQELYERPANVFVAGFVGSPAMNFLHGRIVMHGDEVIFDGGAVQIRLNGNLRRPAAAYAGKPVILGIRPEDVEADPAFVETHPETRVESVVEVIEPLGPEVHLYLRVGAHNLTARVEPGLRVQNGDRLCVALNAAKVHLFDPDNEQAIR